VGKIHLRRKFCNFFIVSWIFASEWLNFPETTELTEEQHRSVKSRLGLQTMPVKQGRDALSPVRQHQESVLPSRRLKSRLEQKSHARRDFEPTSVNMTSVSSEGTNSTGIYSLSDRLPMCTQTDNMFAAMHYSEFSIAQ
jgi:hypothetical protein